MCDPISVAIALSAVAVAGTLAGTGISVYASQEQGKFQKDMSKYQAGLERERARLAEENAGIQSQRLAEQRRLMAAEGMSAFAASGMLIDDAPHSAVNLWEQDMAAETAWQIEALKTQAMYEAWGLQSNASMLQLQGSMARRGAILEGWGTGLSGVSRAAGYAAQGAMMASGGGGDGGGGGGGGGGGS